MHDHLRHGDGQVGNRRRGVHRRLGKRQSHRADRRSRGELVLQGRNPRFVRCHLARTDLGQRRLVDGLESRAPRHARRPGARRHELHRRAHILGDELRVRLDQVVLNDVPLVIQLRQHFHVRARADVGEGSLLPNPRPSDGARGEGGPPGHPPPKIPHQRPYLLDGGGDGALHDRVFDLEEGAHGRILPPTPRDVADDAADTSGGQLHDLDQLADARKQRHLDYPLDGDGNKREGHPPAYGHVRRGADKEEGEGRSQGANRRPMAEAQHRRTTHRQQKGGGGAAATGTDSGRRERPYKRRGLGVAQSMTDGGTTARARAPSAPTPDAGGQRDATPVAPPRTVPTTEQVRGGKTTRHAGRAHRRAPPSTAPSPQVVGVRASARRDHRTRRR
ncbi:hypothetical protein BU14_0410s0003 [Porphyra umbilicalis]|uniref:Uncharacterized protein n=1 Tax=Porphyra umbilicalis TaxID=2786 RepID=A0A1X6NVS0_PORUM|nr:hypothetical protein BU14_0410s0003 [Porphyra umbilicalis]|eukprot:OSX72719.1 hypothetical protein BU14_0410s0003 [Porphyra umbilicalis]